MLVHIPRLPPEPPTVLRPAPKEPLVPLHFRPLPLVLMILLYGLYGQMMDSLSLQCGFAYERVGKAGCLAVVQCGG